MGVVDFIEKSKEGEFRFREKAIQYFDELLSPLNLTEEQIQKQDLDTLKISLDRINDAISHPESFGALRVKMSADAGLIIAKSSTEAHFEMGILPILLERKKIILQRIRSLEGEKTIESINDLITQIPDENLKSKLSAELEGLKNSSRNIQKELNETENQRMQEQINLQERTFKLDAERAKLDMEKSERKAKVTQSYLERESVATLIGGALLVIIIVCLLIAMFFNIPSTDIINNALLLILGYFFGQSVVKIRSNQNEHSINTDEQIVKK